MVSPAETRCRRHTTGIAMLYLTITATDANDLAKPVL